MSAAAAGAPRRKRWPEALDAAALHREVRVVVLHGQSDLFTAGNDVGDFLQRTADTPSPAIPFLRRLAAFEKPLVAAVGGSAVGIGTTMLLHCDLVYAGDNAAFSMPFVKDIASRVAARATRLLVGLASVGVGMPGASTPEAQPHLDAGELRPVIAEVRYRLRALRRECMWPHKTVAEGDEAVLGSLWVAGC